MVITDVRIRKIYHTGKMRGIASVTFDDQFVVHDIKVIEGQNGYFIAMPSRKTADGEFKDICHPIVSSTRHVIQEEVLKSYEEELRRESTLEANSELDLEVDSEEPTEMGEDPESSDDHSEDLSFE
ncbi:MAG: septation regulator SpoVG [Eubacteriaceae bacterium]|jgi:stage V sporulation protein G|nr:septation regulator SpoVG [Eubacteriaceae bacterium]